MTAPQIVPFLGVCAVLLAYIIFREWLHQRPRKRRHRALIDLIDADARATRRK